jgi:hypothetical protein
MRRIAIVAAFAAIAVTGFVLAGGGSAMPCYEGDHCQPVNDGYPTTSAEDPGYGPWCDSTAYTPSEQNGIIGGLGSVQCRLRSPQYTWIELKACLEWWDPLDQYWARMVCRYEGEYNTHLALIPAYDCYPGSWRTTLYSVWGPQDGWYYETYRWSTPNYIHC